MSQQQIAGVQISVVRNGETLLVKGYGIDSVEPRRAVDPQQSLFRIGSISKTFTWLSIMQLVERGIVSLEDEIQKYAPEFPRKPQGEVRLRHLLTHTSGVRHYKGNEFNSREYFPSTAAGLRIFKDDPLLFAPERG